MASVVKWESAWSSIGSVASSELNSLASNTFSGLSSEYDNSTALNQYGKLELSLAALSPTAGAYVEIHMLTAPDGTTYEQTPAAAGPSSHTVVSVIPINTSASATKLVTSPVFFLQPAKTKFCLYNACGVSFSSAGNALKLYVSNDEGQ